MNVSELLTQITVAEKALSEIRNILTVSEEPERPVSTPEEALRRAELKLCTVCGEPLPPPKPGKKRSDDRGAHNDCYSGIMRGVRARKYTDAAAVAAGWLLPAKKGGRPRSPESIRREAALIQMDSELAKKSKP